MSDDTRRKAESMADRLLDEYPEALDDVAILRLVIAMAYLEGLKDGSEDTMGIMRLELERLAAPQSLRAVTAEDYVA